MPRVPDGCVQIAFSPYIAAVVCLIHIILSETDNIGEVIEKVFDKNDNFKLFLYHAIGVFFCALNYPD